MENQVGNSDLFVVRRYNRNNVLGTRSTPKLHTPILILIVLLVTSKKFLSASVYAAMQKLCLPQSHSRSWCPLTRSVRLRVFFFLGQGTR